IHLVPQGTLSRLSAIHLVPQGTLSRLSAIHLVLQGNSPCEYILVRSTAASMRPTVPEGRVG
ncbi:MAG: hypothetical protein ABF290_06740, partial [Thiogranum sp.]